MVELVVVHNSALVLGVKDCICMQDTVCPVAAYTFIAHYEAHLTEE